MERLTGQLTAISTLRHNGASDVDNQTLDFSIRPPVAMLINRITSQLNLDDVSGLGTSEQLSAAAISLDENETQFTEISLTALADVVNTNSSKLFIHVFSFDGQASASGGAAGQTMAPLLDLNYAQNPVEDRPVTMTPRTSSASSARKSGDNARTVTSFSTSTR